MTCPCGTAQTYDLCCGRLHRQEATAVTAEQLMRSRFSAFAVGDVAHLVRTWHPDTRPPRLLLDASREWTGLEIVGTTAGGMLDSEGTVEFRARSTGGEQHEVSRFERVDGAWVYVSGTS